MRRLAAGIRQLLEGATSPVESTEPDQLAVLEALVIRHARGLLEVQIQDVDELATKALGVLGFDGLVLALLIGARDDLDASLWIAVPPLLAAAGLLLATVWPQQKLDTGPDPGSFYERLGAEPRLFASEQMLAHVISAFDQNAPKVARRTHFFNAGFVLLLAGLVGSLVVVFVG